MSNDAQTLDALPDIYRVGVRIRSGEDVMEEESQRRRCFEALFREHVAGIASYCRWRASSAGEVDDAVAEVFLVAWRRLEDVPRGEAARAWLYATARWVIANQARSAVRRTRLQEKLNAQPELAHPIDDPFVARVENALAALDPPDREILLLAEWEGFAPDEIAKVLRRPAVTVRGRLHRARRRFRAAYALGDPDSVSAHGRVSPIVGRCEP
jgi:RNA polymerase sigma-70 factor, ECF subfamily